MSHENMDLAFGEPEHKKKHPVRATIITLLSLVVIAALVAGGYVFMLAKNFDSHSAKIESAFPSDSVRPEKSANGASNILLLGSDSGGGSGDSENLKGVPNAGRSDTIMLIHVPADRKNVFVTSIMRDTWVPIPGKGSHKINAAFSYGGVPLAVQTLETLLDTRIDHVASIDMEGFKGLTEAIGGVDVNVPSNFTSGYGHYDFTQGQTHLEGDKALAFVRERKSFKDGDYQRVKNQQTFIKAVVGKVLTPKTLANPAKMTDVVDEISPYIAVDDEFGAVEVGKLGASLARVRSGDMHFFTLPNKGTGWSNDGQSIVVPDDAAIDELATALKDDKVGEFVQSHGL
ncbi:LCP family protein [Arthrobacter rhombi]|uniref:LCP family protein n=1 Tax=Arthrobacter rhombi TaxID=71253 RepID=UPI003FD07B79